MYSIPTTPRPIAFTPQRRTFLLSELTTATTRIAELTKQHPSWPACRVRATVAREMDISTVQLRYMLNKAAEIKPPSES
ncbi:MAG: hypothetical protein ACRYFZ_07270 [Janthinobacterium lividum]